MLTASGGPGAAGASFTANESPRSWWDPEEGPGQHMSKLRELRSTIPCLSICPTAPPGHVRSEGMWVPSRAFISKMHQSAKILLGGWGTQAQWATLVGYAA